MDCFCGAQTPDLLISMCFAQEHISKSTLDKGSTSGDARGQDCDELRMSHGPGEIRTGRVEARCVWSGASAESVVFPFQGFCAITPTVPPLLCECPSKVGQDHVKCD